MEKIKALRERLQGPRRHKDAVWGRYAMRPLSIYITVLFLKCGMSAMHATLLSALVAAAGVAALLGGHWVAGILLVNGWYLLDHVDGEMARFRAAGSPTGLYFDTVLNAFSAPGTLFAVGAGLSSMTGQPFWLYLGALAAYGSLMLLVVYYCESAVVVQCAEEKWPAKSVPDGTQEKPASQTPRPSVFKKGFMAVHYFTNFPVILPLLTAAIFTGLFAPQFSKLFVQSVLIAYAAAATLVWPAILAYIIIKRRADYKLASLRGSL